MVDLAFTFTATIYSLYNLWDKFTWNKLFMKNPQAEIFLSTGGGGLVAFEKIEKPNKANPDSNPPTTRI